jgi:hypothetical protein
VLVVLVVGFVLLSQVWTEALWYSQLGYINVLWTEWGTRVVLFAIGFLLMAGSVWASITIAYRNRPLYAPSTPEQATLDQYREAIEPLRKVVTWGLPILVGLFAGGAAAGAWKTFQLALHSVSFGTKDPQFGIDLSFYVFTLPMIRFVVGFLIAIVIVSGIVALATHYLYGGLRLGPTAGNGPRTLPAARVQLAVTGALLLLLWGANYWLDRYSLLTSNATSGSSKFAGADFTDVNAVLPAKAILAGIAILVAVAFVITAIRGDWRLPGVGVGLMIVAAIAIGGIYPAVVQRFQVNPNEQAKESPYIQRNIDATRTAFGLDDVDDSSYNATTTAKPGALKQDAQTTAQIRLLDPQIVSPSFRQLQQNKQYYNFADTLAVDTYPIKGQQQDTVIAARELDLSGLGADQRNWVNDHTVYTHGYGVVAAYGNTTTSDGRPDFFEGNIPSSGLLGKYQPRIYFGQSLPEYSIVGAPKGTTPWELDYPDDSKNGQVNTTFSGNGGPKISSFPIKLMYAVKMGSEQILFSDRVNKDSQILYDRDPRQRVQKVAPYLTLDGTVYPAVVDGRVKWIVDGYTTSKAYPYATGTSLDQATLDTNTQRSRTIAALAPQKVNYIRNSVKATVDAYDGSVTLYAFDPTDPVLKAWTKVFPNTVEPLSTMSADLMSHVRYPEDLFKVQRTLLASYHVTDASRFFLGQDFWNVPKDPTTAVGPAQVQQPPYYLTLQMPDQTSPSFSLTSSYVPGGNTDRQILTGFLAVDADAGDKPGVVSKDYGKLRLLELPRNSTVPGPGQVQNDFNSDTNVSTTLNLLKQGNSEVTLGNLLTLPVGGGLLYVQPVYVQSSTGTAFPLLRKVLVAFGDQVGFADTLDGALDQVFGGNSGASAGDAGKPAGEAGTGSGTEAGSGSGGGSGSGTNASAQQDLDKALSDAHQAITDSQAALGRGDFTAYGQAQTRLKQAVTDATKASDELEGAAGSSGGATPSPTSSPTPTPAGG